MRVPSFRGVEFIEGLRRGFLRRFYATLPGARPFGLAGLALAAEPVSRSFGLDRGRPIDRYYIERFLENHSRDIAGRVLEIGDDTYTRRFGGSRVASVDVLNIASHAHASTVIADLGDPSCALPDQTYNCVVLTQTLQFIYDFQQAVRTLHRILRLGGILLLTVPGISQVSRYDAQRWGDYWRFTTQSVARLLGAVFGATNVEVHSWGNVLVAAAFLYGLAAEDLPQESFQPCDPDYEVLIAARAVRR